MEKYFVNPSSEVPVIKRGTTSRPSAHWLRVLESSNVSENSRCPGNDNVQAVAVLEGGFGNFFSFGTENEGNSPVVRGQQRHRRR